MVKIMIVINSEKIIVDKFSENLHIIYVGIDDNWIVDNVDNYFDFLCEINMELLWI